jgi:hypothetical protein
MQNADGAIEELIGSINSPNISVYKADKERLAMVRMYRRCSGWKSGLIVFLKDMAVIGPCH